MKDPAKCCPMCGRKLPHCRHTKFNSDKTIGIIERKCPCGMLVVDTTIRSREFYRICKRGLVPWVPFDQRPEARE